MNTGLQAFMDAMNDKRGDDTPRQQPPLPEAQVAELDIFYRRYTGGCKFKPGDYVIPVANASLKSKDYPSVVLELRDDLSPDFKAGEFGTMGYGAKVDMRLARLDVDGDILVYWVESMWFVPYVCP